MSDWKNVQYKNGKFQTNAGGGGGGSSTLAGLDDVSVSSPANGQVLKYNNSTSKWENADESGGGGNVNDVTLDGNSVVNGQGVAALTTPNVSDLKDANISNPSDGQTLQYNNTSHKWENVTPASGGNVDDVKVNGSSVVDANKVAQIISYKEVTQSEYENLPASKLSDGVAYFIKDSTETEGFPPLIYSTSERQVGVWVDGKPLYQKTINIGVFPSNNSKEISIDFDIELCVSIQGFAKSTRDGWGIVLNDTSPGNVNGMVRMYINYQSKKLYISTAMDLSSTYDICYATLYYTKTTDTAGQGIWAGNGAMAHHYSTDEIIVGMWIDGKPLYEKTFTNVASGTQILSGIDTVVDFRVSAHGAGVNSNYHVIGDGFTIDSSKLFTLINGNVTFASWSSSVSEMEKTADFLIVQYTKTTD